MGVAKYGRNSIMANMNIYTVVVKRFALILSADVMKCFNKADFDNGK